jgi:hypothetical protein
MMMILALVKLRRQLIQDNVVGSGTGGGKDDGGAGGDGDSGGGGGGAEHLPPSRCFVNKTKLLLIVFFVL